MITKSHYYFMLLSRPWPFLASLNAFRFMFSVLIFVKLGDGIFLGQTMINLVWGCFIWWLTYSLEFNLEGKESLSLEIGLKYSIILFISSEVFFFFSFFWSYFHFYISPTIETGLNWPPLSVQSFNCLSVPLVNTLLLLSSGVTLTVRHAFLIEGGFMKACLALLMTIALGIAFTFLQALEYASSFFSIRDSTFGTAFFMLTGFHGAHVVIGTLFLLTVLSRSTLNNPGKKDHVSFEMASWYWHFVDVVWIFLFFLIYYLNH